MPYPNEEFDDMCYPSRPAPMRSVQPSERIHVALAAQRRRIAALKPLSQDVLEIGTVNEEAAGSIHRDAAPEANYQTGE